MQPSQTTPPRTHIDLQPCQLYYLILTIKFKINGIEIDIIYSLILPLLPDNNPYTSSCSATAHTPVEMSTMHPLSSLTDITIYPSRSNTSVCSALSEWPLIYHLEHSSPSSSP